MKRGAIILLSLFLMSRAYSQDSLWQKLKIDENITVAMPSGFKQIDTSYIQNGKKVKFKMYAVQAEYSGIGVVVSNEFDANIDNRETLEKALSEISKGAIKKMKEKRLNCVARDTMLGKIPCKRMMCEGKLNGIYMNILHYAIVINDKAYIMQASFVPEYASGGREEMNRLLKSVQIDATSIKELEFESKTESISYKLGYIGGMLVIPALLVIGVIYFVRRSRA